MTESNTAAPGPLADLRVLDLSRVLAGPMATQILADLGAEVIKIERPGTGDETRSWGPPYLKDKNGADSSDSTYFLCANRGKKSVTVDLSVAEGRSLIAGLAAKSDVLVENFKAHTLTRYGLGYEQLREHNPRLVYCSITGFGQTGPYSARAGYDPIAQAMGGLLSVTGECDDQKGGGPQRVGVAVTDILTATYSVIAILAALKYRKDSGQGQHIDMGLLDVQVACMINVAQAYLSAGVVGKRQGTSHPSVVPSQIFRCADRPVMLVAANNAQFSNLCEVLCLADLPGDSRFVDNAARSRNRAELIKLLAQALRQRTADEWTIALSAVGVPCGPVNDIAQVFADPQVQSRGLHIQLPHASAGMVDLIASPLRLSATPVDYRLPPPLLGEHTVQVLTDVLGIGAAEIRHLRMRNVI